MKKVRTDATCCLAVILFSVYLISSSCAAAVAADDTGQVMGAYIPDRLHLEDMKRSNQTRAVSAFLAQGFF